MHASDIVLKYKTIQSNCLFTCRYGLNIYRHAEHWIATSQDSGWNTYDTNGFTTCPVKGFHGCLDQYQSDGSVQFENLF